MVKRTLVEMTNVPEDTSETVAKRKPRRNAKAPAKLQQYLEYFLVQFIDGILKVCCKDDIRSHTNENNGNVFEAKWDDGLWYGAIPISKGDDKSALEKERIKREKEAKSATRAIEVLNEEAKQPALLLSKRQTLANKFALELDNMDDMSYDGDLDLIPEKDRPHLNLNLPKPMEEAIQSNGTRSVGGTGGVIRGAMEILENQTSMPKSQELTHSDITTLQEINKKLTQELAELQGQKDRSHSNIMTLQEMNVKLSQEVTDLRHLKEEAEDTNINLLATIDTLESEIQRIKDHTYSI